MGLLSGQFFALLGVIGTWCTVISFFLPAIVTPLNGAWVLSHYSDVLYQGFFILYVLPPVSTLLIFIAASINKLWSYYVFGSLALTVGILGIVVLQFLFNNIFLQLFFNTMIDVQNGFGYKLDLVGHLLAVSGSLGILCYAPFCFRRTRTTTKTPPKPKKSSSSTKQVESNSQGLRQRNSTKSSTAQQSSSGPRSNKNSTHNSRPSPPNAPLLKVFNLVNIILFVVLVVVLFARIIPDRDINASKIKVPSGFKVSVYAEKVVGARSMVRGDKGILFVGTRKEASGKVYALIDRNNNGKIDQDNEVVVIESGLDMPNGVEFQNGSMYLAEVSKLWRYDNIEENLLNNDKDYSKPGTLPKTLLRGQWPSDSHHGWRYLKFDPNDPRYMYVPFGAPCNVCVRNDSRYATIMKIDVTKPEGTVAGQSMEQQEDEESDDESTQQHVDEIYVTGVRNSLGLDFHPKTGEMWFTENGRDFMTEGMPPDELNYAPRSGLDYGFPYCFGKGHSDPETNPNNTFADCKKRVPASWELDPHVAVLAINFYNSSQGFPSEYRNTAFVAEHGSWNRVDPIGYRVMLASFSEDSKTVTKYETFMSGFIQDGVIKGRPVDILTDSDGSLLVSDDHAGLIYRVSYVGK